MGRAHSREVEAIPSEPVGLLATKLTVWIGILCRILPFGKLQVYDEWP